jgi:hypothetical protein
MARMEPFLATNFKCNWCEMSWVACDKLAIGLRWFKLGYQQAALSFTYHLNDTTRFPQFWQTWILQEGNGLHVPQNTKHATLLVRKKITKEK